MKCKNVWLLIALTLSSCTREEPQIVEENQNSAPLTLGELAKVFSELPIQKEHLKEVYDAVNASSGNGYDEEYTLRDLILDPGGGVGDSEETKAARLKSRASGGEYSNPLRTLLAESLDKRYSTKAEGPSAQEILDALAESDYQLYCPYSEDWDGESYPIISFDPGYGAESNYGWEISIDENGAHIVDSVYVDEAVAKRRPVWIFNNNDDSAFTPLEMFLETRSVTANIKPQATNRQLILKSFKMLRNYDSWFGGASEFWIKLGAVDGFTASTEAELRAYSAGVTDLMIVVKRKYVGVELPYDALLLTDFTNQMEKFAFLITEDDGGTRTSWKCEATVKYKSKSYGFDINIPYNEKDDIVWRGHLAASYFQQQDVVTSRFGDVIISFELD